METPPSIVVPTPVAIPLASLLGVREEPPVPDDPKDDEPEGSSPRRLDAEERKALQAFLGDPEVRHAIHKVATKRVPARGVEDVERDTEEAIARKGLCGLPPTQPERLAYVAGIARNKANDWHDREKLNRKIDPDADVERSDEAAAAAANVHRDTLLKVHAAVAPAEVSTFQCMVREALGEKLSDIARDLNIDYDVLYKRVRTLRRKLEAAVGGIALVLLTLAGAWHWRKPAPQGSPWSPAPVPTEAVSTPRPEPEPERDPVSEAHGLRQKAFDECLRDQWKDCLDDLASASALDHAGDQDPKVQAAWQDAEMGLGGKGWQPPRVRLYGTAK